MTPGEVPRVVHGIEELRALVRDARSAAGDDSAGNDSAGDDSSVGTVVLVPTMGALHAGHLAHVTRARELGGFVVVSVFVNPLQFGAGEDLERYPHGLDADVEALASVGADVVFAPSVDEMYPDGPSETRVTGGAVATLFEGASRPGHFDGMLTVVAKLLSIVRPDVVTFGQKDAQQVFLVDRMVRDLNLAVRVARIETVRESDGLALSSRNRFLGSEERAAAVGLSAALRAAASAAGSGVAAATSAARAQLDSHPLIELDYFAVVDPHTFLPVGDDFHGTALALVAARIGTTRLIDNATLVVTNGDPAP